MQIEDKPLTETETGIQLVENNENEEGIFSRNKSNITKKVGKSVIITAQNIGKMSKWKIWIIIMGLTYFKFRRE